MSWMIIEWIEKSFCFVIQFVDAINLFHVAHILMRFTYLFMFVLAEELDSPAYPEDFQEIEVKEEAMEYDAVSCDLF